MCSCVMFRNKTPNNRECHRIHSKGPCGRKWDMIYNKIMKISLAKYNQPLMNHENLQASSLFSKAYTDMMQECQECRGKIISKCPTL